MKKIVFPIYVIYKKELHGWRNSILKSKKKNVGISNKKTTFYSVDLKGLGLPCLTLPTQLTGDNFQMFSPSSECL